jgi:NADPH-dependent ferric siderophore reductase
MDRPVAERVRHELKFRLAEVVRTERITPRMARITFTDPSFAEFPSLAYDDHVKIFVPPKGSEPVLPVRGPNGVEWPAGAPKPEGRDYTPRSFDRDKREVVIDFVLHEGGVAAEWAASAKPGDRLGIGGPRASFVVRDDLDFYLLIGDETALPAIGRRIEELPAETKVIAIVEIAEPGERQSVTTKADLSLTWVDRSKGDSLLEAAKSTTLPHGRGYVFIAGEASVSTALREHFVALGHDPEYIKAAGYWRRGEADFDDGHAH